MLAIAVPMAAPRVPNAGTGPAPRMNTTFRTKFRIVIAIAEAQRRPRIAGRAQARRRA